MTAKNITAHIANLDTVLDAVPHQEIAGALEMYHPDLTATETGVIIRARDAGATLRELLGVIVDARLDQQETDRYPRR
ncbi:MAG: hypothetical protein FJ206_13155 [Gemmatimonadetes bacterium]|nr:hypothetical protein [Gemmatimonadota bacterium]